VSRYTGVLTVARTAELVRIRLGKRKIDFSSVFAGPAVDIKEVHDDI
jgi:hypothetical protein